MIDSMLIRFGLFEDLSKLKSSYEERLNHVNFMIEKLKSNSYKSDNSKEIMKYSLERDALELDIKKLEETISNIY